MTMKSKLILPQEEHENDHHEDYCSQHMSKRLKLNHSKHHNKRCINNCFVDIVSKPTSDAVTTDTSTTITKIKPSTDNNLLLPSSSPIASTTIVDIFSVEDIFFNILTFFIHKNHDSNGTTNSNDDSDKNDILSFRSIMSVSKQWYKLSSSTKFWATFYANDAQSKRGSIKKHRRRYFTDINHGLIGFARISHNLHHFANRHSIMDNSYSDDNNNDDNSNYIYHVKERATNKQYILKISNINHNIDQTHSQSHLREVFAFQRTFHCHDQSLQNEKNNHCNHLSLLVDWEIRKSSNDKNHLLQLYNYNDANANDNYMHEDTNMNKSMVPLSLYAYLQESKCFQLGEGRIGRLECIKNILLQILQGVIELHKCGLVHRNLHCKNILIYHDGKNNQNGGREQSVSVKIKNFSKCKGLSSLQHNQQEHQQQLQQHLPHKSQSSILGAVNDLHSIGEIFSSMLTKLAEEYGDSNSDSNANDEEILIYELAFDLLEQLRCLNYKNYNITPTFVKHPFFTSSYSAGTTRTTTTTITTHPITSVPNDNDTCKLSELEIEKRFQVLKRNETIIKSGNNDNRHHTRTHATSEQWEKLVDWLFEIICVLDKSAQSVFMAMGYLDIVLSNTKMVKKNQLQLFAATCLHIASKIEDDKAVDVKELHYCADRTFQPKDIIELEEEILQECNWCLSSPTIIDFTMIYLEYLQVQVRFRASTVNNDNEMMHGTCFWLSQYLSEFALQSNLYLRFNPSLIAASVVALSRHHVYKSNSFPKELESLSGYSFSDLSECIITLSSFYTSQRNRDLKIIPNRYKKSHRGGVSKITLHEINNASDLQIMI